MNSQKGFALVELVVAAGVLAVILGGLMLKVDSISKHMAMSEQTLALDSFEKEISLLLSDQQTFYHSVSKAGAGLRNCVENEVLVCRHGRKYNLDVYLEGTTQALTGSNVYYDRFGRICKSSECRMYQVKSLVIVGCAGSLTCPQPDHITLAYEISSLNDPNINRRDFIELKQYAGKRFPGLSLSCPNSDQVLRGIGINGEPLCVESRKIELVDENGSDLSGKFKVAPRNCSDLDKNNKDQSFIVGISSTGELLCASRFW